MKAKILASSKYWELQQKLNEALEDMADFEIIAIKYSMASASTGDGETFETYSVLILYKEIRA